MKNLLLILICCLTIQTFTLAQDLSTPEKTFEVLLKAINDQDIDTYEKLWHPDEAEREGQVSRLKENPRMWEELQGIFRGKQKITKEQYGQRDGQESFKCYIKASKKADGGGIGTLSMVKVDDQWLMWSW